jgi:hypothetical protein
MQSQTDLDSTRAQETRHTDTFTWQGTWRRHTHAHTGRRGRRCDGGGGEAWAHRATCGLGCARRVAGFLHHAIAFFPPASTLPSLDAHPHAHADALRSTPRPAQHPCRSQKRKARELPRCPIEHATAVGRLAHLASAWFDNYESAPPLPPPSAARWRSHWRVRVGITFFGERGELGRMLR